MAFHQGPTRVGQGGFAGRAVNTVCRLRDSDELRAALRDHGDADLAVLISGQLFDDVTGTGGRDLRSDLFHPVTVRSEGGAIEAWISVPGASREGRDLPPGGRVTPAAGRGRYRTTSPVFVVNIDEY